MPLASKLRNRPFSVVHGSGAAVQPYSTKLALAVLRRGKNVLVGELSKEVPVVTLCVYGFHIGCETAATLRKAGFDAKYMSGGHYAWKAINGPTKLFE